MRRYVVIEEVVEYPDTHCPFRHEHEVACCNSKRKAEKWIEDNAKNNGWDQYNYKIIIKED